jgi:hypothetical protein
MMEALSNNTSLVMTRTRILPLPSSSMSLSRCMAHAALHLNEFSVDTSSFHEISQKLDVLTEEVWSAQCRGDKAIIPSLLKRVAEVMKEANLILKMMIVVEKGRLPEELIDHLVRIRRYNDQTILEIMALLATSPLPG